MAQFKPSKLRNAKAMEDLYRNRQGSLLDFIDDSPASASPSALTSTKALLTGQPHLEAAYGGYRCGHA